MSDGGPATGAQPDHAGVIGPPPLLYGAALVIGAALEWLWPTTIGLGRLPLWLGLVLVLAGFAIALAGALALRRGGTNIPPHRPTTRIVTDGPYRYSRNPLYLALTLIYAGVGLIADDLWILVMLLPLLLVVHWGVIRREERYLEGKFGETYRQYKESVRRWL
jgi:protein-S-isoprenylcysteine O-methyltransferase Ste14